MKTTPPPPASTDTHARVAAAVILVAELGLLAVSVVNGDWNAGRAPALYAWRDVAVVHALCALPLALLAAAYIQARVAPVAAVAVAALCLAAGTVSFTEGSSASVRNALVVEPLAGFALRPLFAVPWALAAALAALVWLRVDRPARGRVDWKPVAALGLLGVAALSFPPATYVGARCRHDSAKLSELLEQSRVGEARELARGLLVLDAGRDWNGRPIPEVAAQIDQTVDALEARLSAPLRSYAAAEERLGRARMLAMLGRTDEALEVLDPVNDPALTPEVEALRGTIRETRGDWDEGLTAYRAARMAWEKRPSSPARDAGIAQAATGVAYCLRKSGRYAEAEAAYEELLTLAPTADTHFLLAQFYEDAQQSAKAREHARRAMELAPQRYAREGERLIKKLAVNQFGCFGVYQAEGRRGAGEPPPDDTIRGIK